MDNVPRVGTVRTISLTRQRWNGRAGRVFGIGQYTLPTAPIVAGRRVPGRQELRTPLLDVVLQSSVVVFGTLWVLTLWV